MSLMLYDFECKSGHKFEELVQPSRKSLICPTCNLKATRLVAAPKIDNIRMGVSPDFPTAARKWERSQMIRAKTDKGSLNSVDRAPNLKMY